MMLSNYSTRLGTPCLDPPVSVSSGRYRSDDVIELWSSYAAMHDSVRGTSRTSGDVRLESAKWVKADIDRVAVAYPLIRSSKAASRRASASSRSNASATSDRDSHRRHDWARAGRLAKS